MGNTLIRSLRLRSSGGHSDPELAVEVRRGSTLIRSSWLRSGREPSDPDLAVEVRRGTLCFRGCCWGPVGSTVI